MHNDLPARSITGGDVRGVHGAEVHRGDRIVPIETPKADTMPGVWIGTHRGVRDGTPPPHSRDWSRNQLKLAASQTYITPTQGVRLEISADIKAEPFPLPLMPGILPYVEQIEISLQKEELGVSNQDPRVAPQTPP